MSNTLGSFRDGTSIYSQFVGIFSLFEIWESTTGWDHSSTTKANLLTSQLDLYENYWDLTQGTTYDGFVSKNPCKRRQELNLPNVYFTHISTNTFKVDIKMSINMLNLAIIVKLLFLNNYH